MADTKTNYLAKLLTLLVKRSSNVIRIPIQDLMTDDVGQGFQVYFDQESKELVLSFVPSGSTIYKIENGVSWLSTSLPTAPKPPSPLSQEDLVARAWTESAATPTLDESLHPRPPKNKVIHLTDETMVNAEIERRKAVALRAISEYQSPQPSVRPTIRSSAATMFSKP